MENGGVLPSPARPSQATPAVTVSVHLLPLLVVGERPRRGAVLSVHDSALNLVVDGSLVAVASVGAGGLPSGLLVGDPFRPRDLGVRRGMSVTIAGGRVAIDQDRISIDVRTATAWDGRLEPIARPADLPARCAFARTAGRVGRGLRGMVDGETAFRALRVAVATGRPSDVADAGRALIGLGAGLTPAGDDVLVGLTAGWTALGDARARPLASAWAAEAVGRTTVVAEDMHRHAAIGSYAERIHHALVAVLAGAPEHIPAAVAAAASWGATSGGDVLAGLLLALDAAHRVPGAIGREAA